MDCLVKLYGLPELKKNDSNMISRRVMSYEKRQLLDWIQVNFSSNWSDECSAAFSQQPIACFIAVEYGNIIGFACYDCTQKNFFGPMGVKEEFRNQGIASQLLLISLQAMNSNGYAYAIIGGCDNQIDFYSKVVGAIPKIGRAHV